MILHNKVKPDFSDVEALREGFRRHKERVLSICALCWIMDPANRATMDTIAAVMR